MRGKVFVDTNIILYAYSGSETDKQELANRIIADSKNPCISNQVINEVINVLYKKFSLNSNEIKKVLFELESVFNILTFSIKTQILAVDIKDRYKFQFYDSLIIATALENGCKFVYSEDMQHLQNIDGKLQIINPFK